MHMYVFNTIFASFLFLFLLTFLFFLYVFILELRFVVVAVVVFLSRTYLMECFKETKRKRERKNPFCGAHELYC